MTRMRGRLGKWTLAGAVVALGLAGSLTAWRASAASVSQESTVVSVTPARIMDTRNPTNVGLAGPFVSAVSQDLTVTGAVPTTSGIQTVVPTGATGVLMNVTVVSPTANGFISIRPADAPGLPTTSSLNFEAGAIVPNAVQVNLPTAGGDAGKIEITYDAYGTPGPTTDILIDVVGYTTDAKLNALQAEVDAAEAVNASQQTEINDLKAANATQDAYIKTVLLGTAPVPSGQTVTGFGTFDHSIIVDNEDVIVAVQLPGRASAALNAGDVNFAPHPDAGDDDATCTGTTEAPTSPPGKVCLYLGAHASVDGLGGYNSEQPGFDDQFFLVQGFANGALGTDLFFRFSWAYTAP